MIGKTVSHYRILAKLGEGGMGVVYRAHDERLDRDVAIKVLPQAVAADPERLARFEREAKAVAKIAHPNILEIFDFGREGEVTYAVTEVLDGETLCDRLQGGAVSWRQAAEIGAAIADGLAAAHHAGIVHRDLKPSNVFITSEGRVKILDFGLARHDAIVTGAATTQSPTLTYQTDPGTVLGTVGYMSPEQVRGDPVDGRSDIFSLGCVLYEMVSGDRAFVHDTAVETMNAILNEEPTELSSTDTVLPPGTESTIRRCLEKRPESRFQSASDLAYNLRSISSVSAPSITQEQSRAPMWSKSALWLPMTAMVALAVGVLIWAPWEKIPEHLPEVVLNRVAVAPLENRTGDPSHENTGVMATEAIIQRFTETGAAETVAMSLGPAGIPGGSSSTTSASPDDLLIEQARQKKAAFLLSGACYLDGETLRLRARLTDTASGKLVYTFGAETVDQNRAAEGIAALGEKVVAGVAAHLHPIFDITIMRPPSSYKAYQALHRAEEIWEADYAATISQYRRAVELDPEFNIARITLAFAYLIPKAYKQANEERAAAEEHLDRFTPFERAYFSSLRALLAGDRVAELAESRQMVKLAPHLTWVRRELAAQALVSNRPREAIEALEPQVSNPSATGYGYAWWPFQTIAASYHLLDNFESEIKYADLGLAQFPDIGLLYRHKAVARAAMGQTEAVKEVIGTCQRIQIRGFYVGQIMSDAASELRYHGHPEASAELATRSVEWFERESADSDPEAKTPFGLWSYAHALRIAGRGQEAKEPLLELDRIGWMPIRVQGALGIIAARTADRFEAERIFAQLPDCDDPFSNALRLYWRACIAAHLGKKDRAVTLLREAVAKGLPTYKWDQGDTGGDYYWQLHADVNLEPLWHYPPFEELLKPKG